MSSDSVLSIRYLTSQPIFSNFNFTTYPDFFNFSNSFNSLVDIDSYENCGVSRECAYVMVENF
jgi:hypothetical protein